MTRVFTVFAALVLALVVGTAQARTYADRTLNWTCPTTRADGAAFSCATDAAGYDIEVVKGTTTTTSEVGPTATSFIVTADPAGTKYRIRVCDKAGECSLWSNQVTKPGRPGNVVLSLE